MSAAEKMFRRIGERRVMQHNADEVDLGWQRIQFMEEPLTLRPRSFVERTVEYEHERIGGAHGVVTVVLQLGEALKIILQSDFLIAVKFVISQRRINWNFVFSPGSG